MGPVTVSLLVGAFLLLLATPIVAAIVVVRAVKNHMTPKVTHLTKRADDTWRVLNGFVAENGYSDNYTKTQVVSAETWNGRK